GTCTRASVGGLDHTGVFRDAGPGGAICATVRAADVVRVVGLVVGVARTFGAADARVVDRILARADHRRNALARRTRRIIRAPSATQISPATAHSPITGLA